MPLLGAHVSIAGGRYKAPLRGKEIGCSSIQLFTGNPTQWETKKLAKAEIEAFHKAVEATSVHPAAAHTGYLINLASARKEVSLRSYETLLREMERAELLGIGAIVMHPGSHLRDGEKKGIRRIGNALYRAFDSTKPSRLNILLETTSGQGTSLGYRFEQIAEIIRHAKYNDRLGVCLDTCHVFAAGYDFRSRDSYERLIRDFDRVIGLHRLKLLHVNDSKGPRGSRLDRHEHIGKGHIGLRAFSFLLNDQRLKDLSFLLETPKGKDGEGRDMDLINLEALRKLVKEQK